MEEGEREVMDDVTARVVALVQRVAEQAVREERARCVRLCMGVAEWETAHGDQGSRDGALACAKAIKGET